jgi:hypothetical protein
MQQTAKVSQSDCELCKVLQEEIESSEEADEKEITKALIEVRRLHLEKVHQNPPA